MMKERLGHREAGGGGRGGNGGGKSKKCSPAFWVLGLD